jgi:hypothetical protein
MWRVLAMLACACAVLGAGAARAQDAGPPTAFCFDFDRLGADGADLIDGTSAPDHVATFGGDDLVHAFGGADCVSGGAGSDTLVLGPGDDEGLGRGGHDALDGGPGSDALLGGLGADRLFGGDGDDLLADDPSDRAQDLLDGGAGNDRLQAGLGADVLRGGPGDDTLYAANGAVDAVDCGDGRDRAFADRGDRVERCEAIVLGARPAVRRTPPTGTGRTTFRLSWDGTGAARVEPAGYAPARAGCARGSWRIRVAPGRATLRWTGRLRPCPGRYTWRVTALGAPGERVDCETATDRLSVKGSPPESGCARRETVGEASFAVRAAATSASR